MVLTYNLSVPPAVFTLTGARLAGAKAVVSVNDVNVPGETVPASPLFRIDFALQRWLMPKFDGHVVVADEIAHDFFPGRQYVRIEGGVDQDFIEAAGRRESARVDAPLVLAFAGTLNEVNGIPLIIEALGRIRDRRLRLRIAGTGPLEEMVRRAAREDPRIEFLGRLGHAGIESLYDRADLLLNVRLTGAVNTRYFFPSKLIEYLGSGVPTITTRVAHSAADFAGLAYFLDEESPQALARLIDDIASRSPEERAEVGQAARTFIARNKSWDVQAANLAEYLWAVLVGPNIKQN